MKALSMFVVIGCSACSMITRMVRCHLMCWALIRPDGVQWKEVKFSGRILWLSKYNKMSNKSAVWNEKLTRQLIFMSTHNHVPCKLNKVFSYNTSDAAQKKMMIMVFCFCRKKDEKTETHENLSPWKHFVWFLWAVWVWYWEENGKDSKQDYCQQKKVSSIIFVCRIIFQ